MARRRYTYYKIITVNFLPVKYVIFCIKYYFGITILVICVIFKVNFYLLRVIYLSHL